MHAVNHPPQEVSAKASSPSAVLSWFLPGEPHAARGPFARWPRATDGLLTLAVFAVSLVTVAASARKDGEDITFAAIGGHPAGAVALLGAAAGALLWRRHRPVAVSAFQMVVLIGWSISGYGDGQEVALVVALYAVGRYTDDQRTGLAAVGAAIGVSIVATLIDSHQRVDVFPAVVLSWLPWYLGRRVRNRGDYLALLQERTERLEADQQAQARKAVADERSRIARELHDVVAHQVSMMTVQAGAARTIAREDVDAAVAAMGDVETAGRQALGELRHLLGVLRPNQPEEPSLGPQPSLADVPALAEELTHIGAQVSLCVVSLPAHTSAAVELSAYRIVQESLTNVIKHAGPRPHVAICIGLDDIGLVIEVTNTISSAAPGLPTSGFGISGMRERAILLGGTLVAGAQPPNQFRVEAHLPLGPERS